MKHPDAKTSAASTSTRLQDRFMPRCSAPPAVQYRLWPASPCRLRRRTVVSRTARLNGSHRLFVGGTDCPRQQGKHVGDRKWLRPLQPAFRRDHRAIGFIVGDHDDVRAARRRFLLQFQAKRTVLVTVEHPLCEIASSCHQSLPIRRTMRHNPSLWWQTPLPLGCHAPLKCCGCWALLTEAVHE